MKRERKCSFLKKRTKKLLTLWGRAVAGVSGPWAGRQSKSFLLLFFKKEDLSSFLGAPPR
jgi:hypothetical protein